MADQGSEGLLSPWLRERRISIAIGYLTGRVLDFGCGSGKLCRHLGVENYFGYDVDLSVVKIAQVDFPSYTFSNQLPEGEKFDSVVSLAVIEHISNPVEYLEKIASYLTDKGEVILTTPHPFGDWIHDLGSKLGLFSSHANEEHEELIDNKKMKDIAEKAGFSLIACKRFLFGLNQLFVLRRLI